MLNVVINDELRNYMKEHNHDTISLKVRHNDYSTGNINTLNPKIRLKEPNHKEKYDLYRIDEFKVFVEKDVVAEDETIEFVDEHVLGIHRCHVKGLKLDNDEVH